LSYETVWSDNTIHGLVLSEPEANDNRRVIGKNTPHRAVFLRQHGFLVIGFNAWRRIEDRTLITQSTTQLTPKTSE